MAATDNCSSTAYGWFKASYRPACTTHGGKLLDAASSKPSGVNSSYSGGDTQTTSRTSSHTSSATSEVSSASSAAVSSETSSSGDESAPNTSEPDTTSLPEDLD